MKTLFKPQRQVKSDGVTIVGRLKSRKRNTGVLLLAFDKML